MCGRDRVHVKGAAGALSPRVDLGSRWHEKRNANFQYGAGGEPGIIRS